MYGSDALAGTVNIITNEPAFSPTTQLLYGFNGFYSSNENGMRGTVTLGGTVAARHLPRPGRRREATTTTRPGSSTSKTRGRSSPAGTLKQADTIDANFGFAFNAFPDPFNAPYVRTDDEILNSQAEGNFVNASGAGQARRSPHAARPLPEPPHGGRRLPRLRAAVLLQRHVAAAQQPRQGLGALRGAGHHAVARQPVADRLLPAHRAPAAERRCRCSSRRRPPSRSSRSRVFRLDILSDTEQRVWTPGVDLHAVFVPAVESPADDRR